MTPHQARVAVVFGVLAFGVLAWTGIVLAVTTLYRLATR